MPFPIQIILLALLGTVIGAFINWAIYQWAVTRYRPISPFMKRNPDWLPDGYAKLNKLDQIQPRTTLDFIPIVGWFGLRRDENIFGKGSWIRPLLIELTWTIGLPLFFLWQIDGGLIGGVTLDPKGAAVFPKVAHTLFWIHTILIALMFIATFIDFDERMIPDQVTVPGTVLALLIAALLPLTSRLPFTAPTPTLGVYSLGIVDFASPPPNTPGPWHAETAGLASCLAIFVVWALALLPKTMPSSDFKLGIAGSLKIMLASIIRPRRKSACEIRKTPRSMRTMTKLYLAMLVIGVVLLPIVWSWLGPPGKLSLVSAFIGLAISGGLIWGIRIVGGLALGQEAMGFGDVTLMCMVGAFLGWQVSIAGFVYSIVFAVFFAILLFVITRRGYMAFGPYLCMGSLLALIRWPAVWNGFNHIFWLGPWLLLAFGGSLLLMAILLPLVRWLKESLLGVEQEAAP